MSKDLIEIHLNTHSSTSDHALRTKYRSAVYTFSENQFKASVEIIAGFQNAFNHQLITKVYPFKDFKPSIEASQNYYIRNSQKPFCKKYIHPKLDLLLREFSSHVKICNTL